MEDSRKKPIMVGVIVACLVLAVVITVKTGGGNRNTLKDGIPKKFAGQEVSSYKCIAA